MKIRYRVFNENTDSFEQWHTIKQNGSLQETYKGLRIDLSANKYDRNDKKIYEKDIVYNKYTNETSLVIYDLKRAMFVLDNGYYQMPLGNFETEDCLEIIGNYHQNKDIIDKMDIYYHIADYIYGEFSKTEIFLDKTAIALQLTNGEIKELEQEVKEYYDVEKDIKFDRTLKDFVEDIYNEIGGKNE